MRVFLALALCTAVLAANNAYCPITCSVKKHSKGGFKVVTKHQAVNTANAHGPRTQHPNCMFGTQAGACMDSRVISHQCSVDETSGQCKCVCAPTESKHKAKNLGTCYGYGSMCKNHPNSGLGGGWIHDSWGEKHANGHTKHGCLKRAADHNQWCGDLEGGKYMARWVSPNGDVFEESTVNCPHGKEYNNNFLSSRCGWSKGCFMRASKCPKHPTSGLVSTRWVPDVYAMQNGYDNEKACMKRAHQHFEWCGLKDQSEFTESAEAMWVGDKGVSVSEFEAHCEEGAERYKDANGAWKCRRVGCWLKFNGGCPKSPTSYAIGNPVPDTWAMDNHPKVKTDPAACGARAHEHALWCKMTPGQSADAIFYGNGVGSPVITTYMTTAAPTPAPTKAPTMAPTKAPTRSPTKAPTRSPTKAPTRSPTKFPTRYPTKYPTKYPTRYPTKYPTRYPTKYPTKYPTRYPTKYPTPKPQNRLKWSGWGRDGRGSKNAHCEGDCDSNSHCKSGCRCEHDKSQSWLRARGCTGSKYSSRLADYCVCY